MTDPIEGKDNEAGKGRGILKYVILTAVVVILIAVPVIYLMTVSDDDNNGVSMTGVEISLSGPEGESVKDIAELEDLGTFEGPSAYEHRFGNWRGNGTYKGIPLDLIADEAGGMREDQVMKVTASDGYYQNLSYGQVYPVADALDIQGRIILAVEFDGVGVPEWEDGPMIAVIPPDGGFSNEDLNMTAPEGSRFKASSAGSIWVRNIASIEIIG